MACYSLEKQSELSPYQYPIDIVTTNDVIESLNLTEESKIIMKSIIMNLEKCAADSLKEGKCICIANVGNLHIDTERRELKTKYGKEFKKMRKESKDAEEYKAKARKFVIQVRNGKLV